MAVMRCKRCDRFVDESDFDFDKMLCINCVLEDEEEEELKEE